MPLFDAGLFDSDLFDTGGASPPSPQCALLLEDGSYRLTEDGAYRVLEICDIASPQCARLLEDGSYRLLEDGSYRILEICDDAPLFAPNGNRERREYQPTYYELQTQRDIERKFEEARLELKSTETKIENLEFRRLRDLADQAMQAELLRLLMAQQELQALIAALEQQKLMALNDDEDFLTLLMCL